MTPVYKLSTSSLRSRTSYGSMLANNPAFLPGNFDSIETAIVGSGGVSSITFNNIPSGYKHLQLRGHLKDNRNVSYSSVFITFNSDTGANYSAHDMYADGRPAISSGASTNATYIGLSSTIPGNLSATTSRYGDFVIDILDYSNENKYTTLRALAGYDNNSGGTASIQNGVALVSGNWRNTSVITSITFSPITSPFLEYSRIALYGIK